VSWDDYLPVTRRELTRRTRDLWDYALAQTEMITKIGERTMARVDDVIARLGAATDELARDLEALRQEVAGLDESVAAKFEPLVSRLEAMGADDNDPVPDAPAEEPGVPELDADDSDDDAVVNEDGSVDVVNPTPGAEDNR
jgi:hypothetical protein